MSKQTEDLNNIDMLLEVDKRQEEILRVLYAINSYWLENPELRLGQIIVNMNDNKSPFYMTDEALLEKLTTRDDYE